MYTGTSNVWQPIRTWSMPQSSNSQSTQLNIPAFLLNPTPSRVAERDSRDTEPADDADSEERPRKKGTRRRADKAATTEREMQRQGNDAEPAEESRRRPVREIENKVAVRSSTPPKRAAKPMNEPGSVRVLRPEPEAEAILEPAQEFETDTEMELESAPEPMQDLEPEVMPESEPGEALESDADAEPTEQAEPELETDADADAAQELEPELDSEAESAPLPNPIIDTTPDIEPLDTAEPTPKAVAAESVGSAEDDELAGDAEPLEGNEPEVKTAPEVTSKVDEDAPTEEPTAQTRTQAAAEKMHDVATTQEDEIDAMMKSVMRAVSDFQAAVAEAKAKPVSEVFPETITTDVESKLDPSKLPTIEDEQDEPDAAPQVEAAPTASPEDGEADEADEKATSPADQAENEPAPEPASEPDTPLPTLAEDLETLNRIERRLFAHRYASTELDTFGASLDPAKASADRSEALAVLAEEDHELLNAPGVGEALDRLQARAEELPELVATQVRVLARDRHRVVSVPADLQTAFVRLTAESYETWLKAKADANWVLFAPYLDRLVDLKRQIALARDPSAHPYDTLLDEFEPGTNRAFYNSFFGRVKQAVVPLLSAVSMSKRNLSRACVEGHFDERRQWDLAWDICGLMGIDDDAHYLTSSPHPFSDAMTSNYAVTSAHVVGNDVMSNVYTMLHELGHSLYEQGVNPEFNRTSLKGGVSCGIHESQSRFFENYVGRDRAFMRPLLALMRNRFPGQMSRVTPNQLYLAVNRVSPSLIRVTADELSYPLHILVRYEVEQLLLDGKAKALDVPKLWADRYESYIGVRPTDDAQGALQDVHWAMGEFGYFPSYALGNAYAAQLRAKMIDEGIDWNGLLRNGDLAPIRAWLKKRVWQFGRSKEPRQIIEDACGEPFSVRHYATYLTDKYTQLYGLGRS